MEKSPQEIKRLLNAVSNGDSRASDTLFPIVYNELHRLAAGYMRRERPNHTLQPTALIHEAFLRLTDPAHDDPEGASAETPTTEFRDLGHFVATAAVVMRRILVNHARAKGAIKRGGNYVRVPLDDAADAFNRSAIDLIELDQAMEKLAKLDETQHRLVELRFFGGMTTKQCAQLLGISERAAYYEWAHARAWLKDQIENE